jgi:hypothetical protein
MAKLTRKLKKIFSINSPSDIGVWGSINATTSTDPDDIQSTGYETGISAAEVSGKKILPRKDFNGLKYETDYHLAYLYQSGIPEYDATTTYYIGDIVRGDSTSFIYKSLVNDNTGNALTSASWLLCGDLANGLVNDNLADNGDFIIAQRGKLFTSTTTFTNDDSNYTFDRYKVGNSAGTTGVIDVSQITDPADLPDGARAAISLLHQQADKQAYIAQYYDNDTTKTLLNKDVSLSFEIYNSDSVTRNFRAAILSWQGAADNMPFYPVTAWQTANDLIFDGNFTIENTTTTLTANATSWNRFTINGVNIDTANTNNLAIVIWTDEEMPNSYEWRATKIKLEQSSIATAWKAKSVTDEYKQCIYNGCYIPRNRLKFNTNVDNAIINALFPFAYPMRETPSFATAISSDGSLGFVDLIPNASATAVKIAETAVDAGTVVQAISNAFITSDFSLLGYQGISHLRFYATNDL